MGKTLDTSAFGRANGQPVDELWRHRIEQLQLAPVAEHSSADLQQARGPHRAADLAGVARGEPQLRRHRPVDARIAEFGLGRDHFRRRPAEGADDVDRVTARVHQRATGKRVAVTDVGELRQREAEGRLDSLQLSYYAR